MPASSFLLGSLSSLSSLLTGNTAEDHNVGIGISA